MKFSNWLHTQLVLPVFERERHARLGRRLQNLVQREKLSLEENKNLQWQALRSLLQHAYETTMFYRTRMQEAQLTPEEVRCPEDLRRLPPLTRNDIRENLQQMCSANYPNQELLSSATGGTTDTPVALKRDLESVRVKTAAQIRFNIWAGMWPGSKVFHLWGARSDYAENPSWRWRLYDQGLMRNFWAPTSLINSEVLESYREQLNAFRPEIVYAYPTPLAMFCEYLRGSDRKWHRPRAAICTAEAVLPEQRSVIEEVLGCPVFEHYGSREFGMIAAHCEKRGNLHVNPALSYVEYVPVPGAEDEGLHELLITDLTNYGMPLIRYRVNDCVFMSAQNKVCVCGRGYPLLEKIMGRISDVLTLPNGSKVPGVALTNRILQVCPGLRKMQVVQETITDFRIRYIPGESFEPELLGLLRQNLFKFFPKELTWEFERVEKIEREPSGKTRFCISKVSGLVSSQAEMGSPRAQSIGVET